MIHCKTTLSEFFRCPVYAVQEKRKKPDIQKVQSVNGMAVMTGEVKVEPQHGDPTLLRTGRHDQLDANP